ncbi:MAG: hypothetical protein D6726_02890 [Nitrospirae bacterium]|nr:MAG: hypothetical protein D6726_02890 [Nitrospirota bacterium]
MSQWSVLKSEIQKILDDASFETGGSMESYLLTWANRIVEDICLEVNIRNHLVSGTATFTSGGNHYQSLPSDWLKPSKRFTRVTYDENEIPIIPLDELNGLDPDHDDTTTGSYPEYCSIDAGYLYIYPKWDGTLQIRDYYRKPTDMSNDTDTPDLPFASSGLVDDLIVFGVVGKYGFPSLNEKELALQYWNEHPWYLGMFQRQLIRYQALLRANEGKPKIKSEYF